MNKAEKACEELKAMDELAAMDSPIHSMPPLAKLLLTVFYIFVKYSLQGTTQGRYLTGGVPPVRFSM